MSIFHIENGFFGQPKPKGTRGLQHLFFLMMENSILEIFDAVDVKITPDVKTNVCPVFAKKCKKMQS